jgi:outer membrane protein assembly factor BamB
VTRHAGALAAALLAAAVAASAGGRADDPPGWLVYGNDAGRSGAASESTPHRLRALWTRRLGGQITAQPLVVPDLPAPGRSTVIATTSEGTVFALDASGRELWHVRYGAARSSCRQLPRYGLTGTPAVDAAASTLYVADAFGLLHALDLRSGRERSGWPARLFAGPPEHVWGALALVGGAVYVPTASLCDRPVEGKIVRVEPEGRVTATWIAVPMSLGGGGGVWGWGGIAYSESRKSLFVATGNAFRGGLNIGSAFTEAAAYGERLVELEPRLSVRSASHPTDISAPRDLDFVGSPLVVTRPCGELVLAANKNGAVYAWRADDVAAGPVWALKLPAIGSQPLLSQLALAPATGTVVAVSPTRLVRIDIDGACRAVIGWTRKLGGLPNGSPTLAGTLALVARSDGRPELDAWTLSSGHVRLRARLPHVALVAPAVAGGRAYVGTMRGELVAFALS